MRTCLFAAIFGLITLGLMPASANGWDDGRIVIKPNSLEQFSMGAISSDGKILALGVTGSQVSKIRLWDIVNDKELATFEAHDSDIRLLVFSPDGKVLASVADKIIKLWDIPSATERATLKGHMAYVRSIAFSPDSKTLTSIGDGAIIWDVNSGTDLAHYPDAGSATYSQGGKSICIQEGGDSDGHPGYLATYDTVSGKRLAMLKRNSKEGSDWNISANGNYVAKVWTSADTHGNCTVDTKLFNCMTGQLACTLKGQAGGGTQSRTMALSPNGHILAILTGLQVEPMQTLKLWDVTSKTGKLLASVKTGGHLCFSPTSDTLALFQDKAVTIWDTTKGKRIVNLKGMSCTLDSTTDAPPAIFSDDGKVLAIAGLDLTSEPTENFFKVIDVHTGKELASAKIGQNFVLSRDGKVAGVIGLNEVTIFDLPKSPSP